MSQSLTSVSRLVVVLGGLVLGSLGPSCSGGASVPQCQDGVDNDGDGLIDDADPACATSDNEGDDPAIACGDGVDNDGDGLTDFPDDPGCDSVNDTDEFNVRTPDCRDGLDNDGDGKIDYPDDPGCFSANQEGEQDDCPSGPNCPECADGLDNDGDGDTDYPADTACAAASGGVEMMPDPDACGAGTVIADLPASGSVFGSLGAGMGNISSVSCNGRGTERGFRFTVDRAVTLVASTESSSTVANTVLYVRTTCLQAATELACNDDVSPTNSRSRLTVELAPGSYYLIVDNRDAASAGNFQLSALFYEGLGQACVGPAECAPGYTCRAVAPATPTTCELPVCSDGRDDDGDGKIDFPLDPGCTALTDDTETDTCPGADCPACGDGQDNDTDGLTDYPMDPSCASASALSEADCPAETEPLLAITSSDVSGTTAGAGNGLTPTCNPGNTAPDRVYLLDVRVPLATLSITTDADFDAVTSLLAATCTTSIQCEDFGPIERTNVAPGRYAIAIDGWNANAGPYAMTIHGTINLGGACSDPLVGAGVFKCAPGSACAGPAGLETCVPSQCNDTLDADGDGFPGYPTDPGCATADDNDETDDCPNGPSCPQCANDLDDDGDGTVDYPLDPGCVAASGTTEECASIDPIIPFTGNVVGATTAGHADDVDLTCGANGRDDVYRLRLTAPLSELRANTIGSAADTVLAIKRAGCATFDLQCDDDTAGAGDASVFLIDLDPGDYYLIVDDKNAASPGTYNLNVSGLYAPNAACDPTSTNFVCSPGYACRGTTPTCTPAACNDTIDADADGFPGYPTDPGCVDRSDDDETDDCPTGPGCPVCSDGDDNDSDGFTDYPNDVSCDAASGSSEFAACVSADPVIAFTGNVTGATTAGHADDVSLSCTFFDGRDDIYRVFVQQPLVSLTADTDGSAMLTAVAIRALDCNTGADLACGELNSGPAGQDARATITSVAVGEYFVIVDDTAETPTSYELHVTGVIPGGGRCVPSSASFVCAAGFACAGTTPSCTTAACNDTVDADADGFPGYPTDPGCASISDDTEDDDCPSGPNCPACSNDLDDDGDTRIDYPLDIGCSSAAGTSELECQVEADPVLTVAGVTSTGTTAALTSSFEPECGLGGGAPDRVYLLSLRVPVATLTVDTEGTSFDTVLSMSDATCGPILECDDDGAVGVGNSLIALGATPAGTYAFIIDGFSDDFDAGAYLLNVRGTIASGSSCNDPLVTAGVLRCATGTTCQTNVCRP